MTEQKQELQEVAESPLAVVTVPKTSAVPVADQQIAVRPDVPGKNLRDDKTSDESSPFRSWKFWVAVGVPSVLALLLFYTAYKRPWTVEKFPWQAVVTLIGGIVGLYTWL